MIILITNDNGNGEKKMVETDIMEELDSIEDIVPGKGNDWNKKGNWNKGNNWDKNNTNANTGTNTNTNTNENNKLNTNVNKIRVQERNRMEDSNVSRVVIDKNGNKVVRKKLFSVSVGTLFLIAVASIAIYATTQIVMNNTLTDDDYRYSSRSDYSSFLDY